MNTTHLRHNSRTLYIDVVEQIQGSKTSVKGDMILGKIRENVWNAMSSDLYLTCVYFVGPYI